MEYKREELIALMREMEKQIALCHIHHRLAKALADELERSEPVVRCKDCKWQHTLDCPMNYESQFYTDDDGWDTVLVTNACKGDGFCWCGEREDGDGK